ncbi:MAG TPA: GNAT family protein [Actinomycetota bacterium]|nr:GNAT family protein [Actinomycetota bacterium]
MKIETDRLVLEAVTPAVAPLVWDATERSLSELLPWMAWAAGSSLATTEEWAADAERRAGTSDAHIFVMFGATDVVGVVGIERVDRIHRNAALGYWVRSDVAGQGYATEGGAAAVEHAFSVMGLHRLVLLAGVGNHGSNRVAQKLGFRLEGVARDGSSGAFGFFDCNVYALLEGDPRPPEAGAERLRKNEP